MPSAVNVKHPLDSIVLVPKSFNPIPESRQVVWLLAHLVFCIRAGPGVAVKDETCGSEKMNFLLVKTCKIIRHLKCKLCRFRNVTVSSIYLIVPCAILKVI